MAIDSLSNLLEHHGSQSYSCVPESDDLTHAGVKGMKWGVRKRPDTSAKSGGTSSGSGSSSAPKVVRGSTGSGSTTATAPAPSTKSADRTLADSLTKKKAATLSNKQMQDVINRSDLEKKFNKISEGSLTNGQRIMGVLQETSKKVAKQQLESAMNRIAKHYVDQQLDKVLGKGGAGKAKDASSAATEAIKTLKDAMGDPAPNPGSRKVKQPRAPRPKKSKQSKPYSPPATKVPESRQIENIKIATKQSDGSYRV